MAFSNKNSRLDLSQVGKSKLKTSTPYSSKGKGRSRNVNKVAAKKAPRSNLTLSQSSQNNKGPNTTTIKIVRILIFLLLALAVSSGIGYLVYQISIQSNLKPTISEEDINEVLASAETSNKTTWSAFFITDATVADAPNSQLNRLAMLCADFDTKRLTLLYIPVGAYLLDDEKNKYTAKELFSIGKEKTVIDALNELSNITISHYFEASQIGYTQYVQKTVGLTVDYNNSNLINGQVISKIVGSSTEQMNTRVTDFLNYFASDMDNKSLLASFKELQGLDTNQDLFFASMPTIENHDNTTATTWPENSTYTPDKDAWQTMVYRSANAKSPIASDSEIQNDSRLRRSTKVCIWNGTGVSGAAADCKDYLTKLGWNVTSTGNAASFVYDETLIVYPDNADGSAAHLIVSDMKQGRCVRSGFRYSFEGDVLIVVGKDFIPY